MELIRIETHRAVAGMVIAMAVVNPQDPRRQLLNTGFRLNTKIIKRIREMGVNEIMVDYPGLEGLAEYIVPEMDAPRYALSNQVAKLFDVVQHNAIASIPFEQYAETMTEIIEVLLSHPVAMLYMSKANVDHPALLEQSSMTTFISLIMGIKLDWYLIRQRKHLSTEHAKEIFNLGIGAMMHDIGMLQLDDAVLKRFELTGDESDVEYQAHTRLGYEMVRENLSASASAIVLHHHQCFDGMGFPETDDFDGNSVVMEGERIHVYSRIVAIASAFARLARPSEDEIVPTVRVIKQMLEPDMIRRFDPEILRVFLEMVPAFAPGSVVMLSDGRLCVPLGPNVENPCRPRVQVIEVELLLRPGADKSEGVGNEIDVIDLALEHGLCIGKVDGVDVTDDQFVLPENLATAYY